MCTVLLSPDVNPIAVKHIILYIISYLYSPCGPHVLYRASVPVQRCTLPLPYVYVVIYRRYRNL